MPAVRSSCPGSSITYALNYLSRHTLHPHHHPRHAKSSGYAPSFPNRGLKRHRKEADQKKLRHPKTQSTHSHPSQPQNNNRPEQGPKANHRGP
ncbi:hypothetical protein EJ06DRAFT_151106 [Trichodelitschia bisporula]|uniref:Uncharacterized protein n=1 Tax=Trichodelitschia bisporula TaxID=703511 RepID=A0A6G1HNK3_9PEZI|nr:hypothetical protein EJ06DRAFT_151106 [Trichodelitschia bisporula]